MTKQQIDHPRTAPSTMTQFTLPLLFLLTSLSSSTSSTSSTSSPMQNRNSCHVSPSFIPYPQHHHVNKRDNKINHVGTSFLDKKENHHYLRDKKRERNQTDCHQYNNFSKVSSSLYTTSNNSSNNFNSNNSYHNNKKGILSRTARESAVIVEWEPVSELERRIEDGVHYEHYDPPWEFGSEEKSRIRKEWKERMSKEDDNEDQCNNESKSQWGFKGWNGSKDIKSVNGVFCGFRVTQEEMDRLKSANPID